MARQKTVASCMNAVFRAKYRWVGWARNGAGKSTLLNKLIAAPPIRRPAMCSPKERISFPLALRGRSIRHDGGKKRFCSEDLWADTSALINYGLQTSQT